MMYKLKIGIPALFAVIAFSTGCKYNKEELLYPGNNQPANCNTVAAKFNADVLPLITSKCAIENCHNGTASGGQVFQSYDQISGAKDRINVRAVVEKSMPPTGPLLPAEVNILKCWVESGAPNN